jgi:3-mercaptopyruvate sulfurtransferase SseA
VARLEVPGMAFLPQDARNYLKGLKADHLIVIPDGPLHKMPLEALVLKAGKEPVYVMDELPPLVYAPSVAVLAVLSQRARPTHKGPPTLLTVGDVDYGKRRLKVPDQESLGELQPLKFTGKEAQAVAKLFDPRRVKLLTGKAATEKAVTTELPGREFIHLATHGLAEDRLGNLFGALALAQPAERERSADNDGYLTIPEIYRLDLKGCEVAALSACETNVGPQQPLEAGVTLANAFLTAGARRVVASHWSVADDSTAELMVAFFQQVTGGEGDAVSYARALQQARAKVRANPNWAAPFFWAPFVLIGAQSKADAPRTGYARPELLIEATDPDLAAGKKYTVLDVRDRGAYQAGHIPGAVWVDPVNWAKGFGPGADAGVWSRKIGDLGIRPDTPVVVYDAGGVQNGARIWWILRYWGIRDVRLLNGGWRAWSAAGGKVDREESKPKQVAVELKPEPARLATKAQILAGLKGSDSGQIIDTRSSDEFCGKAETAKRNGTIPGAKHLEWKDTFDPKTGRVKSASELARLFRETGLDVGKPATTFCQSGGRASVMAFVLELMGDREVRNYYRSWAEWGNDETTPIVKPKE